MSLKDAKAELLTVLGSVTGLPAIRTTFAANVTHTEEATFIPQWEAEYEYEVNPPTKPTGSTARFLVVVQIKEANLDDPDNPVGSMLDVAEAIRQAFEANAATSFYHLMVTDESVTMFSDQGMCVLYLTVEVMDFALTA